ncbi:hypothetical protein FFLO_00699 [Filobasidium floriforme]|uniref:Major facilitator superfamily (MFS) profile domain-containing protein n=1 Tax=Filobasidium floriforme TaxID=5210 RepID=A0A8K0NTI4_9TREE|nr:major facilitator superfamily domain-containing protein [Filobasidium floriforme]KAG7571347.1 hypothetical protein FFLO_00699 [Filobasidium floriforme]KAH8086300.1 major facilitator superfamily domain-containing protein [Filobasidium floriforme]
MGIGIFEAKAVSGDIPGTCLLHPPSNGGEEQALGLKRHAQDASLILQPQPSEHRDDPLNWSRFRKEVAYASLLLGAIAVGVVGPVLTPDFGNILTEYHVSLTKVIAINGDLVLTYGIASFLCVSVSDSLGRRPTFLVSNILLLAGLIWGALAKSYGSLLGARILQGFGMGAYGCLVNSSITDIFFLHEQGTRIAIWQFAFNGSICLTPVISGILIQRLGRNIAFWVLFGATILPVFATILFVPETVYHRQLESCDFVHRDGETGTVVHDDTKKGSGTAIVQPLETAAPIHPRAIFDSYHLRPWRPIRRDKSITLALCRPALTLLSPNVLYAAFLFMTTFTWFVQLSSLYSQIYGAPPYSFDTAKIGYIGGISPFIGTMLALLSAGPINDHAVRILSKHNKGVFEAEMRLVLVMPCGICFAIGAFGMGYTVQHGAHYLVTAVFLAFLVAGAAFGTICGITYASSAFPARGGDTFGIIMLVKALYAWGNTLFWRIGILAPVRFPGST